MRGAGSTNGQRPRLQLGNNDCGEVVQSAYSQTIYECSHPFDDIRIYSHRNRNPRFARFTHYSGPSRIRNPREPFAGHSRPFASMIPIASIRIYSHLIHSIRRGIRTHSHRIRMYVAWYSHNRNYSQLFELFSSYSRVIRNDSHPIRIIHTCTVQEGHSCLCGGKWDLL